MQTVKLPCHVTYYILLLHHLSCAQVRSAMVKLYSKRQHRRTNKGGRIHKLIWVSMQKSRHCTCMGSFWCNITTKHPKQNILQVRWCSKNEHKPSHRYRTFVIPYSPSFSKLLVHATKTEYPLSDTMF